MATPLARKPSGAKQLPPPNSDFYQFAETLSADELAILKKVRAFMQATVAPMYQMQKLIVAKEITGFSAYV